MTQKLISQGAEAKIYLVASLSSKTPPSQNKLLTNSNQQSSLTKSGTEQSITSDSEQFIIKDRIPKSYRLPELDEKIRTRRTRSEAKLLDKASKIIPIPKILKSNEKTKQILMEFIDGKKLSEDLNKFSLQKQKSILKQIGQSVAKLHNANIIHGDLTTSNMILVEKPTTNLNNLKKNNSLTTSSAKKSGKADFVATNRALAPIIFFIDFGLGYFNGKFEDKAVDIHLLRQALEAKHFQNWKVLFKEFLKEYKKSPDSKTVLERLKAVEKRGRYKG
ncbi:MAG: Kae1-associated serine/threonine protein kinase [Nanoarchaeota archaeon]|nr:Kae1-associated serine/threonine protein kinase [Nanoarchaeota archaeon]